MLSQLIDRRKKSKQFLLDISALIAGLILPFAYAPYDVWWLSFPLLAWLFLVCVQQTPGRAFRRGWLFGLGWFVHGVHWVFYSLHYHGGTPSFLAYIIVILLAAYLALFPGLAMYLGQKLFKPLRPLLKLAVVFPALWLLSEWLRGWLFTGFPWLQIGYTQTDTWLSGYAPLFGGLGISGLLALVSGLLAAWSLQHKRYRLPLTVLMLWLIGFGLQQVQWTEPNGRSLRVSLLQGNIPQSEKWKFEMHDPTLALYHRLTMQQTHADLIIWPETAVPDFQHRVPFYLNRLKKDMEFRDQHLLLGIFVREPDAALYYNSVLNIRGGVYRKRHLVPLGEYFPLRSVLNFFRQWIRIPMSDIAEGPEDQPLLEVEGIKLGVNICFEDAFDRDVMRDLPEADILVNVSNDAWFEDSPEAWQHHQIARMRAMESGRYLLRATNTGVSSVIDPQGVVEAIAPQFEESVLKAQVQAYQGSTPYAVWRNFPLVGGLILLLAVLWFKTRPTA